MLYPYNVTLLLFVDIPRFDAKVVIRPDSVVLMLCQVTHVFLRLC